MTYFLVNENNIIIGISEIETENTVAIEKNMTGLSLTSPDGLYLWKIENGECVRRDYLELCEDRYEDEPRFVFE